MDNSRQQSPAFDFGTHPGSIPIGLSLGTLLAFSCPPVTAQNEPLALEEVIVTATRREANLQDVPVAVTALPSQVLEQALAFDTQDIVALVPSLTLQKGMNPRSSSFNIRGIGTQSFSTAVEPSVSTMVDGVVMGRSGQSFLQLLDVDRVEVLRGPQGTLFGKNASGGVIHVITKDPTPEMEGEVMGSAVEGDEYRAGATVSGPLSDNISGRLTAFGAHVDGWIKNYYDGDDRNDTDDWSLRGKLKWEPVDSLVLRWSSDYSDKDCVCSQPTIRSMDPDEEILELISPVQPGEKNTDVNNDGDMSLEVESWGHSLQADWDIGEFTLTSISAYREWEEDFDEDVDNRPDRPFNLDQEGTLDQEQITQELRLASPADDKFNYVVGAFYFDQEVNRTFARTILESTTHADFTVDTENYALFGEAAYNLTDSIRLIAGGRYTKDDISYDFDSRTPPSPDVIYLADDTDETDFSPRFALEWTPGDEVMTYLSYVSGYKGPGFSLTATTTEKSPPIDPETSDAFEVGLKSTLWDGRLRLNAALFYTEYQDWQAEAYVPGEDQDGEEALGVFVASNAGEVTTRGLELDVTAQVTENLQVFGGLTLVDAEIDDFTEGPCSFGQSYRGECEGEFQNLSGGDLPFSPDWKVNLMLNYLIPLDRFSFDGMLMANFSAQDDEQYSVTQDPFTVQDGYEVLDLSAAIVERDGLYQLTVFVKNVLDDHYVQGIGATSEFLIPNGYLQQVPKTHERTAGVELRVRW
jgi:iron complex outermembrane receptor protein